MNKIARANYKTILERLSQHILNDDCPVILLSYSFCNFRSASILNRISP